MLILINDVAEHFNCSIASAAKITQCLMKSHDATMAAEGVVDFKFAGVLYTLSRLDGEWVMVRSVVTRSTDLDDVL